MKGITIHSVQNIERCMLFTRSLPRHSLWTTGTFLSCKQWWAIFMHPGFMRQKSYKIQGFSKPFHSIIQGQFNAILPVDHSIAYSPTDTQEKRRTDLKHWCVIFISKTVWAVLLPALQQLRKFAQSPSLVETFTIDKFQTFQGLPLFFQNNSRPFSVVWNSRTFQGWPWIQGRCRNPVHHVTSAFILWWW